MNNKTMYTLIGALVVVSAAIAALFVFAKPQISAVKGTSTQNAAPTPQDISVQNTQVTLTADELSTHSTSSDCYIAYKDVVYDITSFVPQHRGGPQIVQYCGQVVDDFSSIHPGGSFESPSVQRIMQNLSVGKLNSK